MEGRGEEREERDRETGRGFIQARSPEVNLGTRWSSRDEVLELFAAASQGVYQQRARADNGARTCMQCLNTENMLQLAC